MVGGESFADDFTTRSRASEFSKTRAERSQRRGGAQKGANLGLAI
jgi:hypothetical protein